MTARPPHVVVMGVSGSGKSTVAERLADELGVEFGEADLFHPVTNIEKMAAGIPLTDDDRWPWLGDIAAWMQERENRGQSCVVACSALRRVYRDILRGDLPHVLFLHVHGPMEVIAARMGARSEHFMPGSLLQSQFDTLEPLEPDEPGVVLDLRGTPDELLDRALAVLAEEAR